MKKISLLLTFALLLSALFVSCSGGGGSIIGTWEVTETYEGIEVTMTVTFNEDGTMSTGAMGVTQSGTYTVDGNKITTVTTIYGIETTEVSTFSVSGNQLTITDEDGVSMTLTKK